MENFDLIDRYFENSLSPQERLKFNDLLQSDEEFRNEFIFRKDLKKVVEISQREELKSRLKEIEGQAASNSKHSIFSKKWLVAATLLALFSLGIWSVKSLYYPSHEAIYENYFKTCRNTIQPIVRGESLNTIEYRAFAAYESQDYHKAINLFNSVEHPNEPYILFYKAMCYMALDKTTEAIELLHPISIADNLNGKSARLNEKSDWYLALAYLKEKKEKKAIAQLILISEGTEDTFKFKESKKILNYLR